MSKKATLHVQHTFLLSYTFYGGNVARFLLYFFFPAAHFHLALVAACISHFVTAATKF